MNSYRIGAARQRGVSLIEILVAVVLLAVGLLGLAGLQLRGMQVNQGSQWRAMAAVMADDLADRMRAELDLTASPTAATSGGSFVGAFTPTTAAPDPSMASWLIASLNQLPAGTTPSASPVASLCTTLPCVNVKVLAIASAPTAPSAVEIDIYWNDDRALVGASLVPGATAPPPASVGTYQVVTML